MNADFNTVKRLVLKDWDLHQKPIAGYCGLGILGLAILGYPHAWAFYMGCVTLLTVMIAAGFHAISTTIIGEKKEQTTPFIMSLPVRPSEYVLAKVIANCVIFLVPWCVVVTGVVFLTLTTPIPNGILQFLVLMCVLLIMNYAIVLTVTVVSESEGLSIFFMVLVNLLLNPFIMLTLRNPEFYEHMESDVVYWSPTALVTIASMLAIAFVVVGLGLWRQTKRETFI
ncbi:ABC-2 transporter permease [Gilvimarinus xylanilyticus]|uniref:ABC transporter permease n=1 Tax=Gilvimarinus xylanilyticus TaxID=2944139 RepID=A0A9X2HVR3_9GAMM|nr:ABC-2 transporter permease [Gilvimarinus xylanilyticus]MCP8899065.1 ABC transporter permease [Gilvimarinus xylanilyticus]